MRETHLDGDIGHEERYLLNLLEDDRLTADDLSRAMNRIRSRVQPRPYWDRIVKRLLNPPFGTETSERNLMGEAADAIRYLLERVDPACAALKAEVAAWRECALYDPTMEGPRFKGWDRSALERCRLAAEKAPALLQIEERKAGGEGR